MLAEEVHDFSMDRSRLAAELDSVQAHSRAAGDHNREAARRLDEAMDVIRDIIENPSALRVAGVESCVDRVQRNETWSWLMSA